MKEIKLNSVPYLRGKIISAYVDETTLEFRNGIACVEACITTNNFFGEQYTYKCMGIIDENFCEVYDDSIKKSEFQNKEIKERNLMFLRYNKNITRLGNSDFVVEVSCCNDSGASWYENRYIRIVDGIPILIGKVGDIQKISNENLVISENRLYDVSLGEYITPEFYNIRESETYENVFDVVVKVIPNDENDNSLGFVDYLFFKIDSKGKRVSQVMSSLENGFIYPLESYSVEELVELRKEELRVRKEYFLNLVTEIKNSDKFLEKYHSDLKRKLKKEDV